MNRRETVMIMALSLIWGASFMFIRVADRQFDPSALVWFRLLFACAVLLPVVRVAVGRSGLTQALAAWRPIVLVGLVNTAIPFMLFAWAETRIDSSLAAILQAAAPIFTVLIAVMFTHERVSGMRWAGILLGFGGVALLVGSPGKGGTLASLAAVLAALCYAVGATISARRLPGTEPLVIAAGSSVVAAVLVTPLGLTHLPSSVPGWKESASVVTLGVAGTGIAYIIFFALLRSAGASRTILVTYLVPGVALLYGVVLLGEPLAGSYLAGLALILVGVVLAGGGRRFAASRRKPTTHAATAVSGPER